jgi:hypothetical protein
VRSRRVLTTRARQPRTREDWRRARANVSGGRDVLATLATIHTGTPRRQPQRHAFKSSLQLLVAVFAPCFGLVFPFLQPYLGPLYLVLLVVDQAGLA